MNFTKKRTLCPSRVPTFRMLRLDDISNYCTRECIYAYVYNMFCKPNSCFLWKSLKLQSKKNAYTLTKRWKEKEFRFRDGKIVRVREIEMRNANKLQSISLTLKCAEHKFFFCFCFIRILKSAPKIRV